MSSLSAPQLNPTDLRSKLRGLQKEGITDRGQFKGELNKNLDGYARLDFKAPKLADKPPFKKDTSTARQHDLITLVRRTEKALNYRDAIVAELAQDKPNADKIVKLAEKMAEQITMGEELARNLNLGEDMAEQSSMLTQANWAMGTTKVEAKEHQSTLTAATLKNLLALLKSDRSDRSSKPMTPGARQVFEHLRKGLETKRASGPEEGALTTATPKTGQPVSPSSSGAQGSDKLSTLKHEERLWDAKFSAYKTDKTVFKNDEDAAMASIILSGIKTQIRQLEATAKRNAATATTTNTTTTGTTSIDTPRGATTVTPSTPRPNTATTSTLTTTATTTTTAASAAKNPIPTSQPQPQSAQMLNSRIAELEKKIQRAEIMKAADFVKIMDYETADFSIVKIDGKKVKVRSVTDEEVTIARRQYDYWNAQIEIFTKDKKTAEHARDAAT